MSQMKYVNSCLVFLAAFWFSLATSLVYSSSLSRLERSVGNQEVMFTEQPCPANRTVSVLPREPESTNTTVAYLLLTAQNPNFTSVQIKELENEYTGRMVMDGTDLCSKETVRDNNTAPELRSDCPYIWTKNIKLNRFPEVLMEVKCLCEQPKTNATWESWQTGVHVACEEVKYTVPVLWREDCDQNVHIFRLGFDRITIGCVRTVSTLEDPGERANAFSVTRTS